jgi:hypothetical protein
LEEITWLEEFTKEVYSHVYLYSDNEGFHVKSTGAIGLFTSLIKDCGGATECNLVYSFGAPGHGKGLFDGIGGDLNNKIHSLIKGTKNNDGSIPGTKSRYIATVEDVHDTLKGYFEKRRIGLCENKVNDKVATLKKIKHLACNNPIRIFKEMFVGLEKIISCYRFVVTDTGIVHSIMRFYWCLKFTVAMSNGSLNWDVDHQVNECVLSALQPTTIYDFHKRPCTKLTGPNVEYSWHSGARQEMKWNLA